MKHLNFLILNLFLLSVGISSCAHQKHRRIVSSFPSTVAGLSLANSHELAHGKGRVFRGMAPYELHHIEELKKIGITDVLIFKTAENRDDLMEEMSLFQRYAYSDRKVQHIPFKWKDIKSFKEACLQSLQALRLLKSIRDSQDQKIFFHCTVGEDRTGYMSGLFELLSRPDELENVYQEEMCRWGYADAAPDKPIERVVKPIHETLTPTFFKMAELVRQRKITWENLSDSVCDQEPLKISPHPCLTAKVTP
jgi:hypothetical protein